jgi:hypothetical protein
MTPAGSIHIDLYHCAGQANGVRIASGRPDAAARLLLGKTPEQVLDTVPLLFTLCGNAQAYAALQACRAALDMEPEPELDAARDMLVQLETLREHAWRILLDWPHFLGLAPDKKNLGALLKFDAHFKQHLFWNGEAFKLDSRLGVDAAQLIRLIDELEALIDAAIFNRRLADFAEISSEAQLRDWLRQNQAIPACLLNYLYNRDWAAAGQNDIACLPVLEGNTLNQQMQQDDLMAFSSKPHWQDRCFESTLLNRQLSQPLIAGLHSRYGNGLIVRITGRLVEAALILSRLRQLLAGKTDSPGFSAISAAGDGIGLAQVQAARGLLIHRLVLREGGVYNYCVVAPTEWNFHPEGVAAQGLKQLKAAGKKDLQQQAELLINAVDPCVHYVLNLIDSKKEIKNHA